MQQKRNVAPVLMPEGEKVKEVEKRELLFKREKRIQMFSGGTTLTPL